jgi:hypothetical protein
MQDPRDNRGRENKADAKVPLDSVPRKHMVRSQPATSTKRSGGQTPTAAARVAEEYK